MLIGNDEYMSNIIGPFPHGNEGGDLITLKNNIRLLYPIMFILNALDQQAKWAHIIIWCAIVQLIPLGILDSLFYPTPAKGCGSEFS
jgi:hypothetical protein